MIRAGSPWRLSAGAVALGVAWTAQRAVAGPTGSRAWPLFAVYGLAIVTFALALAHAPLTVFGEGAGREPPRRPRGSRSERSRPCSWRCRSQPC